MALLEIFIISLFVAFCSAIINKIFTDQIKIKNLKVKMKETAQKMKNKNLSLEIATKLQKKYLNYSLRLIKEKLSIKSLILKVPFSLAIFFTVKMAYQNSGNVLLNISWFKTYIIFSIFNLFLMKSILKVE
jgi:hypothetical protein